MSTPTIEALDEAQTKEALDLTRMDIVFAGMNLPEGEAMVSAAHGREQSFLFLRNIDRTISAWRITNASREQREAMANNAKLALIEKRGFKPL